MSIHENDSVFEEVNPFPEKVSASASIDGEADGVKDEDNESILGELEEIALNDGIGGKSIPIHDESVAERRSSGMRLMNITEEKKPFDVESLAREIDSLNVRTSAAGDISSGRNEFLSVLEDDDRRLIDEVTRDANEIELDMFEPVGNLEEGDDSAQLVVSDNSAIEPVSLWKEDNDYYVTDVEGYESVTSRTLLSYLYSKQGSTDVTVAGSVSSGGAEAKVEDSMIAGDDLAGDALGDGSFSISDEDLHDSSIFEDLVLSPENIEDEGVLSLGPEEDEILRLPEDAIIALSEEAEESILPPEKNIDEVTEDLGELPGGFILTPIDLSEAEKIAREDILILNEGDLIEELEFPGAGITGTDAGAGGSPPAPERKVQYVHPVVSIMDNNHRASIEEDITDAESLVIEEDGAEIKRRYEQSALKEENESLLDITDSVVILDDESDVERISMSIPADKRQDMKKLLGYLDGLFEKLPDDVVKSFANSEYFDLYVKIMNDLGDK